MYLKLRGQSRREVKGKEMQVLKMPFPTHNARADTKGLCSSDDRFPGPRYEMSLEKTVSFPKHNGGLGGRSLPLQICILKKKELIHFDDTGWEEDLPSSPSLIPRRGNKLISDQRQRETAKVEVASSVLTPRHPGTDTWVLVLPQTPVTGGPT